MQHSQLWMALLSVLFLASCERVRSMDLSLDFLKFGQARERNPEVVVVRRPPSEVLSSALILQPNQFKTEGVGLWDGRPSFGGVWVATPDADDPMRVLITNTANGRQVLGALFKREAFLDGPPIQVSSEAASALGALAGQTIRVTIIAVKDASNSQ